jgi:hypothetical protein
MAHYLLPLLLFVGLALPQEPLACESRSTGYPDAGKLQGGVQLNGRNAPLRLQSFTLVHDYRWGTCVHWSTACKSWPAVSRARSAANRCSLAI